MAKRPLTWFITGCSSGFGLALVRIAQAQGHFVIATSRNPGRTPELVREVEAKGGKWLQLDVDDPNSTRVIEELEKEGHAIDVLVNNAGFGLYGSAEQFSEEEVRRMFETNFFGPYRLTRTAVRPMRERRFGIVVNISSAAAVSPVPSMSIYGAAKAALDSAHRTLAVEMKDFNVRVLSVEPGVFDTSIIGALQFQTQPLEADYKNKPIDMMLSLQKSKSHIPDGDTKKGVEAIYEVVVGEGVGTGHENEPVLPLGREAYQMFQNHITQWKQTMDVFGHICNNVYVDRQETEKKG
ncbi:hypothetical protein BKA67DRAFT_554609 [Truncatella angustata]|uniref:Uncharacterized protein n=1 Tax=Truncatella angustata TaxID=152316 RepID=A0A9P8UQP2_9PEZI|nr:uncharacterized protein BKA67DRAFT_554609 [Truncatella angustata]KAH6657220.1 hypothetical protein BKA67DRAFT_554609 [Truncatella angustata]